MNQEITSLLRRKFETLYKQTQNINKSLNPQSSFLRIDKPLVNGQGVYTFDPMKQNGRDASLYDRLLDRNDAFIVTAIGLYITYEIAGQRGTTELLSCPKSLGYVAGQNIIATGKAQESYFNAIYNGKISLKTNDKITFDGFPTAVFLRQNFTASPDADSALAGFDVSECNYFLPEILALAGNKDQSFELSFPSFPSAVYNPEATTEPAFTPSGTTGLSLLLQGFLIKNGAIYVADEDGKPNELLFP